MTTTTPSFPCHGVSISDRSGFVDDDLRIPSCRINSYHRPLWSHIAGHQRKIQSSGPFSDFPYRYRNQRPLLFPLARSRQDIVRHARRLPQIGNSIAKQVKFKNVSSLNVKRTVKPGDAAQTLVPSTLKMAARSTLPVATRLNGVSVMSMMKMYTVVGTLSQHTLYNSSQSAY